MGAEKSPPTLTLPRKGGGDVMKILRPINFKRVAFDDLQPPRIMRRDLLQCFDAAPVALDGDHAPCTEREERARQSSGARADFDDGDVFERSGDFCNLRREIEIEKEVLPQRFACAKIVRANDLAQRRQIVKLAHNV